MGKEVCCRCNRGFDTDTSRTDGLVCERCKLWEGNNKILDRERLEKIILNSNQLETILKSGKEVLASKIEYKVSEQDFHWLIEKVKETIK